MSTLIQKHGGYRNLKSFRVSQLVFDITVRFCERYVDRFSRTKDQMVQAARSGVQNIAEGSQASGTSKKTELKLTNVARASLEELYLDYEDYLRQGALRLWEPREPLRGALVRLRPESADDVARWVLQVHRRTGAPAPEIAANAALVLIGVANSLLSRQIQALAASFEREGGFTERLYRTRRNSRRD